MGNLLGFVQCLFMCGVCPMGLGELIYWPTSEAKLITKGASRGRATRKSLHPYLPECPFGVWPSLPEHTDSPVFLQAIGGPQCHGSLYTWGKNNSFCYYQMVSWLCRVVHTLASMRRAVIYAAP